MSLKMKQRFLLEKEMLIFIAIFVFTRIKFPSYLNDSQISVAFICHFPKMPVWVTWAFWGTGNVSCGFASSGFFW